MYLPSNTPILTEQRRNAALHGAQSDACIAATRRRAACGRARVFNALVSPGSVADTMGIGAAVNVLKLQDQTRESRASGLLSTGTDGGGPSVGEVIAGAPEVVSLNRGGTCQSRVTFTPVPLGPDPTPGMPHRAPVIVQGPHGPMYYRGETSTIQGDYPAGLSGLSGFAPPWSDAGLVEEALGPECSGFMGWVSCHPWLSLLIAGGGVYALSRRDKAGR